MMTIIKVPQEHHDISKPALQITITDVAGSLQSSSDHTHITCFELQDIVISGSVAVPDRMFAMPVKRSDGKLTLFPVYVSGGVFNAVLNFPTSGQYTYTDAEANTDLPPNTFSITPIKIDVLRKTGE
ncbi:hypothetical protein S140_168 [Shewanella sp. phage 1/40]|uniref:hypothetical protein n=1 Tax=Shewanella sp. phage 1/40 TaxID=1458860 RepID=UPI0004F7A6B6|nr:hypothetical protein S140_168 [Shewanella sp. phage 1/40]AHK11575.1 hypothetical protein S140_168 [Shewanella sp. phage 1/40]